MPPPAELNLASLVFAILAGLLSFISPCVLPLLPAYLSYITGLTADQLSTGQSAATRSRVLLSSLTFTLGLALVFTALGASATLLGRILLQNPEIVTRVGGLLVIVLGLHLTGLIQIPFLYQQKRLGTVTSGGGPLGALLMGAAFAAGWTPCVGPFLASLLALASQERTVGQGMLLLFVYALGLGIPFIAAGLLTTQMLGLMKRLRPRLQAIEVGSGVLLIAMGLLLFFDRLSVLSAWLTRVFGVGWAQ
jgi:cytochrome c-type biogenesis protein